MVSYKIGNYSHNERNKEIYNCQAATVSSEAAFAADQKTKVALVAKLIGQLSPREQVAEVGSFTGYGALGYSQILGVKGMTCFDLSPAAVEQCHTRGLRAEVWNADVEPCPAAQDAFDIVLALDVIEHLLNTESFLLELRRICKPNGYLILSTPNLAFWLNRLRLLFGLVPWSYPGASSRFKYSPVIDLNHLRINIMSEWMNLLEECNWHVESINTYSLLDDLPKSAKRNLLFAIDRIARLKQGLAFGHVFIARSGKEAI